MDPQGPCEYAEKGVEKKESTPTLTITVPGRTTCDKEHPVSIVSAEASCAKLLSQKIAVLDTASCPLTLKMLPHTQQALPFTVPHESVSFQLYFMSLPVFVILDFFVLFVFNFKGKDS